MSPQTKAILSAISLARLEDEAICLAQLAKLAETFSGNHAEAAMRARTYIENFRSNTGDIGLEEFFRQYGLHTNEGYAVMALAEALLRIPDSKTANLFIHDKLGSANWSQKGHSASSIVKASSLGLKLAAKLMECGRAVTAIVDPVIRESIKQSMRLVGEHFVLGETAASALEKGREFEAGGYMLSYDMLGEGARSEAQAKKYLQNYLSGITAVSASADKARPLYQRAGISVKLSALFPKYKLIYREQVFATLLPRLKEICIWAKTCGICVTIDAEEAARLDVSLELFSSLVADEELRGYDGIGLAVQAYNKSAVAVVDFICELARQHNRRIPVRLVKGAYWDSEIKIAQVAGIANYPVFTRKEYSDISYLVCAHKMLENPTLIYPQFATHNALTIASIEVMAAGNNDYEFQRLYGMGDGVYSQIVGRVPCRIYAPVGAHRELLPYLIRRILENGASTAFLKKVIDIGVTVDELVADPFLTIAASPPPTIPLPPQLYSADRLNALGFDLGNSSHLATLQHELTQFHDKKGKASPIINGKERNSLSHLVEEERIAVLAPYDKDIEVGTVVPSNPENIHDAIENVANGFANWCHTPVAVRAAIIDKFANLLEENCFEAMALCMMEAGKTIADCVAELREAVDFCRYYAARAREILSAPKTMAGPTGERNELSLHARGIFVCISPWNFPLAIFTGQIVAALVAGNTVIAKPAEQTPLIAAFAVKLLLKAGLPKEAIAMLPGDGAAIGKILLQDRRVSGVAFTGSGATAEIISRQLAGRSGAIVPFIAETGGINAMIVDSSAHLEQAVDDIIHSAFGSAGQRCSALRALYVQEDIADALLETLKGALESLVIGAPTDFATDIGPVIDTEAYKTISAYIATASAKGKVVAGSNADKMPENGYFIPPVAIEINNINDLPGEIFGPVLHIIRFKAGDFEKIIGEVNASSYGLTIGLQTRIDSRINYLRTHARVGNMYVNRSMTGATVGVQPFGGEGLSGTGFKAGGPDYLRKFSTERSFTENTAAIGGNRELL